MSSVTLPFFKYHEHRVDDNLPCDVFNCDCLKFGGTVGRDINGGRYGADIGSLGFCVGICGCPIPYGTAINGCPGYCTGICGWPGRGTGTGIYISV